MAFAFAVFTLLLSLFQGPDKLKNQSLTPSGPKQAIRQNPEWVSVQEGPEQLTRTAPDAADSASSFRHIHTLPFEDNRVTVSSFSSTFDPISETIYIVLHRSMELLALHVDGRLERLGRLTLDEEGTIAYISVLHGGKKLLAWMVGLGSVAEFDLETRTINRIDRSRLDSFMNRHIATIDGNGTLMAVGGYGFWEYRNRFLYFDRDTRGWEPMPLTTDTRPLPFVNGRLHDVPEQDQLMMIGFVEAEDRSQFAQVLTFDKKRSRWEKQGLYELTPRVITGGELVINTSNHVLDAEHGLLYVHSGLFYDVKQERFLYMTLEAAALDHLDELRWSAFYSNKRKSWVRVGMLRNQVTPSLVYETWRPEGLSDISRRVRLPRRIVDNAGGVHYTHDPVMMLGCLTVLLAGVVFVGGVHILRNRPSKPRAPIHAPLVIRKDPSGALSVQVSGRILMIEDPVLETMFEILYEMTARKQDTILLTDLDTRLFPKQSNATSISKTRARLVEFVNEQTGKKVLTITRSAFDKRFRVLDVDITHIRVEES